MQMLIILNLNLMLDLVIVEHLLMLHYDEEFVVSDLAKYQIASNEEKSDGVRN